ncbi:MAG TPA: hypothetical protein VIX84_23580 [Acidimicrobiales bacterium]
MSGRRNGGLLPGVRRPYWAGQGDEWALSGARGVPSGDAGVPGTQGVWGGTSERERRVLRKSVA